MIKKIKIIELELGIDVDLSKPTLHINTEQQIKNKIELAKQEQEAIDSVREKRQQKKINKHIEECFRELLEANKQGKELTAKKLLEIAETNNLSSLILRLNNYIKKRGELWKIKKRKSKKDILYSIIIS